MSSPLVFITGASGFIGSHVVLDTLKAGYRVRVNVRREAQIEELKARFSPATGQPGQLEFVVTPDLSDSNAVRSALGDDVEYIFHLASPMPGKGSDFKTEYLHPAVKGTEAVLAAAASAPAVKRVITVSSMLALMPLGGVDDQTLVVKEGDNASLKVDPDMPFPEGPTGNGDKYAASKILAHRATFEWMTAHRPHFSLVTLHPVFVLGYDHTQTTATPGALLNGWVLASLASGTPIVPPAFVDVRDVSAAHVRAIDAPLEPGAPLTEVLLPGPDKTTWEEIVRVVKEKYPSIPCKMTEEGPYEPAPGADGSRAERDLGIEWRSVEGTISSLLDQQLGLREKAGL